MADAGPSASVTRRRTDDVGATPEQRALWSKFTCDGLNPIPGFLENLVVVIMKDEYDKSKSYKYYSDVTKETIFGTAICKYLLQNGVKKIWFSCNFPAQMQKLQKTLNAPNQDLSEMSLLKDTVNFSESKVECDVSVVVLMAAAGRIQHRKMLELVQNALSNSTVGVIIVGNKTVIDTDEIRELPWLQFLDFLKQERILKNSLETVCVRHMVMNAGIFSDAELKSSSPLGGCAAFCGKMDCGHNCTFLCHPVDRDHSTLKYRCEQACEKLCGSGHLCGKPCWKDCGECFEKVSVRIQCPHQDVTTQVYCYEAASQKCMVPVKKKFQCGHYGVMACCEDENLVVCSRPVNFEYPCGHTQEVQCCDYLEDLMCRFPIRKEFPCGHQVLMTCSKMDEAPGNEVKCRRSCLSWLKCGHQCSLWCHAGDPNHDGVKCYQRCRKRCERGLHVCGDDHPCCEPCKPCTSKFRYKLTCGHSTEMVCSSPDPDENDYFCAEKCMRVHPFCKHTCKKLCGEDCGFCEEPCSYACEHSQCTNKCSQVCNKELCFEPCSKLLPCGHSCVGFCGEICPPYCVACQPDKFNAERLYGEPVAPGDRFIYLPNCDHCIKVDFLEQWILTEISSEQILPLLRCPDCTSEMTWIHRFSPLFHENRRLVNVVRSKIFGDRSEIEKIQNETEMKLDAYVDANPAILYEEFLDAIFGQLDQPYYNVMKHGKRAMFESMDIQKARFVEWISDEYINVCEVVKDNVSLPGRTLEDFKAHWGNYLKMIESRYWPLHPNEIEDARKERRRLDDCTSLYSRLLDGMPKHVKDLLATIPVKKLLNVANDTLWKCGPYTEDQRRVFLARLQEFNFALNYTLNVSDKERKEIVDAFGDRSGRWFKCVNVCIMNVERSSEGSIIGYWR